MNAHFFKFYNRMLLIMLLIIGVSCNQSKIEDDQQFDLLEISNANSNCKFISQDEDFESSVMEISTEGGNTGVVIWEKGDKQDWTNGNYLVLEIFGDNDYSGVIHIEFFKEPTVHSSTDKEQLAIFTQMGIIPRLKTKLVFPLSYLDGQQVHMSRFPRQLKATVWGNRLDPKDITKVKVRFGPYFDPDFKPNFKFIVACTSSGIYIYGMVCSIGKIIV